MSALIDKTIKVPNETALGTRQILNRNNVYVYDAMSLFGYTVFKCTIDPEENDRNS